MASLLRVQRQQVLLRDASRSITRQPGRMMATESTLQPPYSQAINASTILNRAPILTPMPTPFEREYYTYQYKIGRALSNPFPQDFYFTRGSTLQQRFYTEERERERKSFGVGYGRGKSLRLPAEQGDKPLPRETEADRTGNVKSLDRAGDRNLYLLVKRRDQNSWRFPQGSVQSGEALHTAAQRRLSEECGQDMDTWIVGRQPIGFHEDSDKIFFFKGHILAGQVATDSPHIADFAWLTKQEIQERVDERYWSGIKNMLSNL